MEAYEDSETILMVGFNRRYSPHALDIRRFFEDRNMPYIINCRVNAGYIENNHWSQDPEIGGGRIIGEVCHFVDFMQFVTCSKPVKVYTEGIKPTGKYKTDDNIVATLTFENGSIGTITYTSKGNKSYPREIIEIYQDGAVYCIEDFRRATKVRDGKRKKMSLSCQDMGHENELRQFLSGGFSSAQTRDCFINALTVFTIQDSLHKGKALFVDAVT
jgi:predicted dehydrogenase